MVDAVDACCERALSAFCPRALSTELGDGAVGRAHEAMIDTARINVHSRDRRPGWVDVQGLGALVRTSARMRSVDDGFRARG
jgi:hypothetical protein